MVKYRVHSDYFATGEGRTISVLYCHAENDADALTKFHKIFGIFYATGAIIEKGWSLDDDYMIPAAVKLHLKDEQCFTQYYSQFYINCS